MTYSISLFFVILMRCNFLQIKTRKINALFDEVQAKYFAWHQLKTQLDNHHKNF